MTTNSTTREHEIVAFSTGLGGAAELWSDGRCQDRIERSMPGQALREMAKRYPGVKTLRVEPDEARIQKVRGLHQWAKRNESRRESYLSGGGGGCTRERYETVKDKIYDEAYEACHGKQYHQEPYGLGMLLQDVFGDDTDAAENALQEYHTLFG